MATKRPNSTIHPSRQTQVPREAPRKRQKPNNLSGSKSFKKARPINELKTSIRNLRRLLERDDEYTKTHNQSKSHSKDESKKPLPPKIRISKERELASAQRELEESQTAEKRSKMIARYHKVRFFDRQKGTKRLKRARKALKEEEDDGAKREELAREVDECELDVQYAMFYPLDTAYVALYPSVRKAEGAKEEGEEVKRQGDGAMRELVRRCAREGKLDALRNGKLDGEGNYKVVAGAGEEEDEGQAFKPNKKQKTEGKAEKKNGKRKAEEMEVDDEKEDSGDESDGGFFE